MRRVAGCVCDIESPPARVDLFPSEQRDDVRLRYRGELAPQSIHVAAEEPRRAVEQPRRIDHVCRTALMHEHGDVRMLAHDRPCGTRVVQVNVRQHQVAHVAPSDAVRLQALLERTEARRWPRVNDGDTARALHNRRGDDVGSPEKPEVDPRKTMTQCVHRICARRIHALY